MDKQTFSEAFFSLESGHTMLIMGNRVYIIEEGTEDIKSILSYDTCSPKRYFEVLRSIMFDKSGLQVAINNKDTLDLEWLLRIHSKTGNCRKALSTLKGACNGAISETERMCHIGLLENILRDRDVEYYLRNEANAELLGENLDVQGAIEIAQRIFAKKAEEIFIDRVRKII